MSEVTELAEIISKYNSYLVYENARGKGNRMVAQAIIDAGYRKPVPDEQLREKIREYLDKLADNWDDYTLDISKNVISINEATDYLLSLMPRKELKLPVEPEVVPGIGWVKPNHPLHPDYHEITRPKIVCLCGSTRFGDAFRKAQIEKTLNGEIVLTIGCNMKSDTELFGHLPDSKLIEIKTMLDELHKRKIDLCDYIYVLNVGGYIGDSTRSEINYAIAHNKPVVYLEALKEQEGQ